MPSCAWSFIERDEYLGDGDTGREASAIESPSLKQPRFKSCAMPSVQWTREMVHLRMKALPGIAVVLSTRSYFLLKDSEHMHSTVFSIYRCIGTQSNSNGEAPARHRQARGVLRGYPSSFLGTSLKFPPDTKAPPVLRDKDVVETGKREPLHNDLIPCEQGNFLFLRKRLSGNHSIEGRFSCNLRPTHLPATTSPGCAGPAEKCSGARIARRCPPRDDRICL